MKKIFLTKKEKKIEALKAELREKQNEVDTLKAQLLQRQIRPHFIFNVILAIKQLCIEDPKTAADALQNFSGYLRMNLEAMSEVGLVPFSQELSCIKEYVAIERSDPAADFIVRYDIGFSDFLLPPLSVQPMVENAVRHGIASHRGNGLVSITTSREGGRAIIVVADNGSGAAGETRQQKDHRSIGIENAKERLRLLCGGELTIANTNHGTIVTYQIPLRDEQEASVS